MFKYKHTDYLYLPSLIICNCCWILRLNKGETYGYNNNGCTLSILKQDHPARDSSVNLEFEIMRKTDKLGHIEVLTFVWKEFFAF